jgi:transcriptional regulator with XRE-family HTH domain
MDSEQPPNPHPASASSPAQEVGASLKSARAARGFSLESVCQHTRIPRKYLEALEAGRFDDLPAPVYLRSFLSGYCEYLEIDMRPLWDKLHPAPAPEPPAAAPKAPAPAHAGRASAAPTRPAPATGIPLEASPYFQALISSLGAVALSLALASSLVWWLARSARSGTHAPEPQTPQALLPLRPAAEPKLVVTCRDEAWLSVKADGALLFAGRLPRGARHEFAARKALLLRAASTENLDLSLNGSPYRLPRPDEAGDYRIEAP